MQDFSGYILYLQKRVGLASPKGGRAVRSAVDFALFPSGGGVWHLLSGEIIALLNRLLSR